MKPSKRIMCPDCGRPKMLFETERKANDFIKWNGDDLYVPEGCELRAYYCPSCCGWHISHQKHKKDYDTSTDRLIEAFHRTKKSMGKIDRLIHHIDHEKTAQAVFDELPEPVKMSETKRKLREYLEVYFATNGINDKGGQLKGSVYIIWERYNNRRV